MSTGSFIVFMLGIGMVLLFCLYVAKHPEDKDSKNNYYNIITILNHYFINNER